LSDAPPQVLGRYQIQGEIGRGMMGVVYRALDPAIGRTVALKTVHLAFAVSDADRENFEKRFLAEARVAGGLSHPGIVVVHDVGRDAGSGTLFIALEFLEGRTLAELTSSGAPMDWPAALRLTLKLADALDHAHAQGIVHRDIKPANIMVLASGEPKIMDFGIAKVPASQLTSAGEFFGTPSYMAPEQARGEAVDGRSDLFSLGAVLYLLLTGRRAFDAPSVTAIITRVLQADPPPPSSIVPGLPPALDAVVARCLAKDPAARYPNGRELIGDLEDLLAERPARNSGPGTPVGRQETAWVTVTPAEATATKRAASAPEKHGAARWLVVAGLALAAVIALEMVPSLRLGRRPSLAPSTAPSAGAAPATEASPEETPAPGGLLSKIPFLQQPARLEVAFEHSLSAGTIKVWVDDDLVIEEKLSSHVTRRILGKAFRKGTFHKTVEVPPGEHMVKVQVQGDDFYGANRIRGSFEGGATQRLDVNKEGLPLLKKELTLEWS